MCSCFGKVKFPRGVIGEDGKQFVKGVSFICASSGPETIFVTAIHLLTCLILPPLSSQLLNRNPKHRLGAQRDAAELKEHPFFKSIDWDLLAQRAVPPPFKPYVDSDESVANFDPEFTEANLFDEAPHDIHWNDNDPSADWLDRASEMGRRQAEHDSGSTPLDIQQRSSSRPPVQPLTNSVQEHFREFLCSEFSRREDLSR